MADTIREFLVGLGFKLDEAGERRFVSMIEGATLRANLLADAIENMARVVVDKVAVVAENFEQLYYQSQRIGASANSIEAFAFTVHKLGGTVEGAKSSLQGFGDFLNNHIGAAGSLAKQLGIPLKDTADRGLFLLEVGEKLSKMPKYLATQYRETFHLGDYDTITKAGLPGAHEIYTGDIKNRENSGIGAQTTKAAVRLEQALKDLNEKLDIYYTQAESSLFKHSANMIEELNKYLENHKKKIAEFVDWLTNLGLFSDAGKTSLHFDEKKFGEHFEKALSAAETATVNELKHLEDALHPVVEWFERFGRTLAGWFTQPHLNPDGTPEMLGGEGEGGSWWSRNAPKWLGGGGGSKSLSLRARQGMDDYKDVPNAGALTKLITAEAQRAGIDPRLMEGIRAGESGRAGRYDHNGNRATGDDSYGPFQLNRLHPGDLGSVFERATAEERKRLGFGGLEDPRTIPLQARFVAEYIKRTGNLSPWAGYHGPRNADPRWGDSGYVDPAAGTADGPAPAGHVTPYSEFRKKLDSGAYDAPGASVKWDQGPAWNSLNASLPVGGATTNDNSKSITSSVTNTIHVSGTDPQSTAAMVGLHLDRSANDLARNLQGAHQ